MLLNISVYFSRAVMGSMVFYVFRDLFFFKPKQNVFEIKTFTVAINKILQYIQLKILTNASSFDM